MKKILFKAMSLALVLALSVPIFTSCKSDPNKIEAYNNGYRGEEAFEPYPYEDLGVFITLPDYKNLTISQSAIDDMMRLELYSFCRSNNISVEVTDGVQKYDTVSIFYVAYIDEFGGSVEEISCRKYDEYSIPVELYVGSGVLPFEDGLIGAKPGEEKVVDVTLPQDYPYAKYRGKEAKFVITVEKIERIPELTDEICASKSVYDSKQEFMDALRANCIFDYQWQLLMGKCVIKGYPNVEYTQYYQYFYGMIESEAKAQGMSLADFIYQKGSYYSSYGLWSGMSVNDLRSLAENYAKSNVVNDLLTYGIMRKEKIKLRGKEWNDAVAVFEREYGASFDEIVQKVGETEAVISVLMIRISQIINGYVTVTND